MHFKSKTGILLLALLLSCISLQAQDADCPCWGEKKAFVAEVYSFNGIGKVPSYERDMRLMAVPGFSFGFKFNKRNTVMLGFNYLELNTISEGLVFCDMGPCYNCHDFKIIQTMLEWKYRTIWKKNFSSEIFIRWGPDINFYYREYYKNSPYGNDSAKGRRYNGVHYTNTSFSLGNNFFFKLNKHLALNISPFFQMKFIDFPWDSWFESYNFIGGIKTGLKYSKYTK